MKVNAVKDGKGNIVISEDSFDFLLSCLDNQKFVGESPQNADSISVGEDVYWKGQKDMQDVIDKYNRSCRDILYQKYVFDVTNDGLYLFKKYENQDEITPWCGEDMKLVYTLFKDTKRTCDTLTGLNLISNEMYKEGDVITESDKYETWLIERPLRYNCEYLTISEDGKNNRPWKEEEIEMIKNILN